MSIENLTGEVFSDGGKVAIAVPPAGMDGAASFVIVKVHPPGVSIPAWADIILAGSRVRINPEICQPPFFRLADCLMVAHHQRGDLPLGDTAAKLTLPPAPHPNAQEFLFWKQNIGGLEVVMIDTMERVQRYSISAHDGQHRHKGGQSRRFKK